MTVQAQDSDDASGIMAPAISLSQGLTPASLTRRQKAAVVVRFLLNEGVDLALDTLSVEDQNNLMQQMAQMSYVDRDTLGAILDEFLAEMNGIGLSFPAGVLGALDMLGTRVDPTLADQIRRDAGPAGSVDPWDRLTSLDPETLLPLIELESVEVAAVVLSKLSVARAADLLGRMPGDRARRITYAVSQTNQISPAAVTIIGQSLIDQLDAKPEAAFSDDPVERVGAILNFSQARIRDDVLDGLDQTDQDFAAQVRKSIFTFENIPARITDRDIPKITKDVDAALLVVAIAAALQNGMETAANFVLDNMSKRLAQSIRDEMGELGTIKEADGEAAMGAVIAVIRDLESTGEVVLQTEGDDP